MAEGGEGSSGYDKKLCRLCRSQMSVKDFHYECLECLECLSTSHQSSDCDICKGFTFAILSCRLGLVGDTIQGNKWPSYWRQKLSEVEDSVWSNPSEYMEHNSPDSSPDEEEVVAVKKNLPKKTYKSSAGG